MTELCGDRAVVLGAGMAGLLAARVLADRYAEVVVVDRDELPEGFRPRPGVPQSRHAHALLARGQQALEALFPGFTDELIGHGALTGDFLAHTRMYLSGHRLQQARTGLVAVSASRGFLEGHVRARLRAHPGVSFRARCDVVGLSASADGGRVTGARLLPRADHSAEEVLDADMVLDATGRTSRTPAWLGALGLAGPYEERVPIDVAYASRRYRLGPHALSGDLAVLHGLTPAHPRGGVLARVEGGEAVLTLAGILGDRPPTDPDGFVAFAESLRFPDIHDAILRAEPLDDAVPYRFPAGVWRHYERLRGLPDGFAVLGDGTCSFNPIYGQGMTLAALEADALGRHLDRHGRLRPHLLHRRLAGLLRAPWQMATGADLVFPEVDAPRPPGHRGLARYIARLHGVAAHDPDVACRFARVVGLVDHPRALFRPAVATRVLSVRRAPGGRAESWPRPAG